MSNCHIVFGFLDVVLSVFTFFVEFNHFFRQQFRLIGDKEEIIVYFAFKKR